MTDRLATAFRLAELGFWLILLRAPGEHFTDQHGREQIAKGKEPVEKDFGSTATRDQRQITQWLTKYPNRNLGIYCDKFGDGSEAILAIDVDNKGKKEGDKDVERMEAAGIEFTPTFAQDTPTGGRHLLYIVQTAVKNSVGKLGRKDPKEKSGIDVRSGNALVVAAGSVIGDKQYKANFEKPAPAPQKLIDECGKSKPKTANATGEPLVNAPSGPDRAKHYLLNEAPLSIKGEGGDSVCYQVACKVKDFGVTEQQALDLMLDHWNDRCPPGWSPEKLRTKIANAFKYGTNPPGSAAPEKAFTQQTPATEPTTAPPAKSSLHFELFHTVTPELDRPALVEGLLERGAMSVVYGESNSGKTFFALDVTLHIALAQDWHGRRVQGGAVVYVAAEGGGAIRKRLAAFRKHHGLDGREIPFALVPCPVNLLNPNADTTPLIELIASVERATGAAPVCVVIDTLSRALGGGNENAPDDMGAFVRNVDRIRSATGAHLLIVHHSGKDKAKGARGHSSLRAATDTEIEIADQIARATKQRDMEAGRPIGFELVPVEIGQDSYGASVTSCIVRPRSLTSAQAFGKRIAAGSVAAEALAAIENLTMAGKPAPLADCRDEFIRLHEYDRKKGRDYFRRGMKALQDAGRIEMKGGSHVALVE